MLTFECPGMSRDGATNCSQLNDLHMNVQWLVLLGAGCIPLLTGFIWYHPKVFGNAWMAVSGMTEEKARQGNMARVMGLTLVMGIILALSMISLTIHQSHMMSTLVNLPGFGEPGSEVELYYQDFVSRYGSEFRTFKHGAFHGFLSGLLIGLPILGVNAMFEQRGWKYIAINVGYWAVTMALMGGVVCAWGIRY